MDALRVLSQHPSAVKARKYRAKYPEENRARGLKWNLANPEKRNASYKRGLTAKKEKRDANKEEINSCYREQRKDPTKHKLRLQYEANWRRNNPQKMRDRQLRAWYKITLADVERMREEQGQKCAICQVDFAIKGRNRAVVDHDHQTGKVRAMLCHLCNLQLAVFDRPGWVEAAGVYYAQHKAAV